MKDNQLTLRFSIQRALLGEVTENLIAVTAGISDFSILIRAYFDMDATESELERLSYVGTEVIADFPDPYEIEEQSILVCQPDEMEMLDFWAFLRADD